MNQQSPIVLLTRPKAQSETFAAELRMFFAGRVVISPIMQIVACGDFAQIPLEQSLIFTSGRAVEVFDAHQIARGHLAFCVGARTAQAAQQAGCDAVSAQGDAAALLQLILSKQPENAVYLCGVHRRGNLDSELRARGVGVETRVVYDQQATGLTPEAKAALDGEAPVILPVFSPRSAEILSKQLQTAAAPVLAVFISEAAAEAWVGAKPRHIIVQTPDAAAMIDGIRAQLPQAVGLRGDK